MSPGLKVLLVEDSIDDTLLLERELLRFGFAPTVKRIERAPELVAALLQEPWDILLIDYVLPEFSALGALALLKERGLDLPVIIVSGAIGEERAVEVMQAGAQDFIRKGNWARLGPAIVRELEEAKGRQARRLAEAELQHATEAAQQERDRLRKVVELLPEGVLIASRSEGLVLINAMMRQLLGRDLASQGQPLLEDLSYPAQRLDGSPYLAHELPLQRSLLRGEIVRGEQLLLRNSATGCDVAVLANSAPITDASGAIAEAVMVCQDISPLHALECARDEFLASAAHDLKNPLVAIKGYAQFLRLRLNREPIPQRAWLMPAVERIEAAATRMNQLISNLLDVARLKLNHPLDLDRQSTDLVALTRQLADEQRHSTDRHRIVVDAQVPKAVGLWDAVRLERVLRNLLANAVKYSPDGGEIAVSILREDPSPGAAVVLRVSDSGIGIPEADQAAIFVPFHRAANVIGRIEGTGVGLASAKQIVEQHGGTITVVSQEGCGATFTVRLPV